MRLSLHIYAAIFFLAVSAYMAPGRMSGMSLQSVPQLDSTVTASLEARLNEYFAALEREPAEVKFRESDFIIGTCRDSLVRQAVTILTYRHFITSKVMGDDAVAIHIYDRWIAGGKVMFRNEADRWAAEFFAETNRRSLIGQRAPEIVLYSPAGDPVTVFGDNGEDSDGLYSVMYFYDTDCAKCRIESIMLRNALENDGYEINLFAIYTGRDPDSWKRYRENDLDIDSPSVHISHLWDPDMTSDMTLKYGIIETPRMFLVTPDDMIAGRNLDTGALERLLSIYLGQEEFEYGSDEAMEMYRRTFRSAEDTMDCNAVSRVAEHIARSTLERGDTSLYRQMAGDLLYYISSQRKESYKCGTVDFIDRYILSRSDIWNRPSDTLETVGLARLMKNLSMLCPAGLRPDPLDIPVTIITRGKDRQTGKDARRRRTEADISRLKNALVIFHTEGCPVCKAEIAAADSLVAGHGRLAAEFPAIKDGRRIRIRKAVLIDMDEIWNTAPELAATIMQRFDLSSLPFTFLVDGEGRVARKYISLIKPAATEQ